MCQIGKKRNSHKRSCCGSNHLRYILHATIFYFSQQGPDRRQLYLGDPSGELLPEYDSDIPAPIVLPSGVVPDAGVVPPAGAIAPAPFIPPAPAILPSNAIKEKNRAYPTAEGCHLIYNTFSSFCFCTR